MAYSLDNYLLQTDNDYIQLTAINGGAATLLRPGENVQRLISSATSSPLFDKHNQRKKRVADIVISSTVILFLLSWFLPLLAVLIKLDSRGPVFFIQKRNKKDGRLFNCIKLRTMAVNNRADTHAAIIHDGRITRLGRLLRRLHIDELPQFFNVLMGDMSVVGPRPHMVTENIRYNTILTFYNDRHFVKPGITGLAQSFGYHGPVTNMRHLHKKIEYDIFYISHWTVRMDVKIILRTIQKVLKKRAPAW